ncbi:MAG: hypothetical protein KME67_08885 [Candidatus Thiodiazotropha sp. (ex Codakia orbicularis)]|nr:hypothetical protein [Candidatus Thiodiazotropha sp. (ex Codakia orbicularis)]
MRVFQWAIRPTTKIISVNNRQKTGLRLMKFQPGQSGNPAGRRKGARNKRTALMKALQEHFGGVRQAEAEQKFWALVLNAATKGDASCLSLIAQRLQPPTKPQTPLLSIDLPDEPVEAATRLLKAAGSGEASVEQVKPLLSGLSDLLKAREFEELDQRLSDLEDQLTREA